MKRTLSLSVLLGFLLLAGCGAATPPAGQPVVPVPPPTGTAVSVSSASSTARSSNAKPLGMTQQQFRTEIASGKSLKDILKSRGVTVPAASSSAAKK